MQQPASTRAGSPRRRPSTTRSAPWSPASSPATTDDEPDLSMREARGDRYLICSDGLSDFVGRRHHRGGPRRGPRHRRHRRAADRARPARRHPRQRHRHRRRRRRPRDGRRALHGARGGRRRRRPPPAHRRRRPMPTSPAAKAAALSRDGHRPRTEDDDDEVELAESGPSLAPAALAAPYRPGRPGRWPCSPAAATRLRLVPAPVLRRRGRRPRRDLPGRVAGPRAVAAVARQRPRPTCCWRTCPTTSASAVNATMSQSSTRRGRRAGHRPAHGGRWPAGRRRPAAAPAASATSRSRSLHLAVERPPPSLDRRRRRAPTSRPTTSPARKAPATAPAPPLPS